MSRPGALRQPQRRVGGRHGHEAVAAHPGDGLRARRGERVVGARERDAVDDDELARRAGHVDALPQRQRAEQAGARVAGELPHQGADLVLALAEERRSSPSVGEPLAHRLGGLLAPRASTRTARACDRRPPAPGPRSRRASRSPGRRGPARAGAARRRRWPAAGSRTGCRRRARATPGRPRRAGPIVPATASNEPPSSSVAEVSTTVRSAKTLSRTSIATLIGATRSTGPRRGSRLSHTTSSSRSSRMREAFSYISSIGRPRHLTAAVGPARPARGLSSHCTARVVSRTRASARTSESGSRVDPPLRRARPSTALEQVAPRRHIVGPRRPAGRPACRGRDHARADLVGDRRGDPVDQLVRLVDDEHVVLGQHLAALEGVDGHERVVGDDDVDVLGGLARRARRSTRRRSGTCRPGTRAAETDTWRQARSLTRRGPARRGRPTRCVSAHSRSRTTSAPEPRRRRVDLRRPTIRAPSSSSGKPPSSLCAHR